MLLLWQVWKFKPSLTMCFQGRIRGCLTSNIIMKVKLTQKITCGQKFFQNPRSQRPVFCLSSSKRSKRGHLRCFSSITLANRLKKNINFKNSRMINRNLYQLIADTGLTCLTLPPLRVVFVVFVVFVNTLQMHLAKFSPISWTGIIFAD
jgi:hypothetical protein